MNIEITECLPQKTESALSKLHPWMMKHHLFANFTFDNDGGDLVFSVFIEDAEEAKELAQELLHCYNKLMHWAENQEEREE